MEPQVHPKGLAFSQDYYFCEKACHSPHLGRDGTGILPLTSILRSDVGAGGLPMGCLLLCGLASDAAYPSSSHFDVPLLVGVSSAVICVIRVEEKLWLIDWVELVHFLCPGREDVVKN